MKDVSRRFSDERVVYFQVKLRPGREKKREKGKKKKIDSTFREGNRSGHARSSSFNSFTSRRRKGRKKKVEGDVLLVLVLEKEKNDSTHRLRVVPLRTARQKRGGGEGRDESRMAVLSCLPGGKREEERQSAPISSSLYAV